MKPVIRFNKETPEVYQPFFRQSEDSPILISVVGGKGSGKTRFIESVLGLRLIHGRRRHRYDVFASISTGSDTDLLVLEWRLKLNSNSLKEDARVLKFASNISDIIIIMPYSGVSYIDYAAFMCQFIEPSDALFVFSPCNDLETINERAKSALSKRRVYTLPMTDSRDFAEKVKSIKEAIYNEITQRKKKSLTDYHLMLDRLALPVEEYDDSYEIDSFLEKQCFMTLEQIARAAFTLNIKPELPMEEEDLAGKIKESLELLIACGRKLVLRPTTTFSTDVQGELKHIFKEWKKENYNLSHEVCEKAYLEFKKQKALDADVSANDVKLVGPAKREFVCKLVEVDAHSLLGKRKPSESQGEGKSVKKQRVIGPSPLKKTILYNGAALQDSPKEVQRKNKAMKALEFFNDKFFRAALGESPLYRITKDYFKIVVRMSKNKSKIEFVDAYRIDQESGEKIAVDQATRNKIDVALTAANKRSVMPSSAIQAVINAAFGLTSNPGASHAVLSPMGIEEDLTFHFPLMEVRVNDKPTKFNKFTIKAKTRLSIVKHVVVFLKVLIKAEKEKQQELFDALRVSCNFGNSEMKNEHFEMFFDDVDHTVVDLSDDPTAEEVSMYNSHEQAMEVSEDKPMDVVDDESLFTFVSLEEEESQSQIQASRYSLADAIEIPDDDE